jgi:hypothetical protein
MATTINSTLPKPIAKSGFRRGSFAIAAGLVIAGVMATTAVLVDDHDGSSPAPKAPVVHAASPADDPLVARYGAHSTVGYNDDAAQDRMLRLSGSK